MYCSNKIIGRMKFLDPIGSLVFSVLVSKLVSDQT